MWDNARAEAVKASRLMRSQGPFMPSILSAEELEYTTRPEVLKELTPRFVAGSKPKAKAPAKKASSKKGKKDVE